MLEALHHFYGKPHTRVIYTGVSGDVTWMKHGHTSQFGIVSVIPCETREVLDLCKLHKSRLTTEEYEEWFLEHKYSKQCQKNNEGSSGSMGRASTHIFFKCSIQKLKLIHISMLGDGDTKSIEETNLNKHFGPHITVTKEECVSHIAKHLYTHLKYLGQKGAVRKLGCPAKMVSPN